MAGRQGVGTLAPEVTTLVDIAKEVGWTAQPQDNGGVTLTRGDTHVPIPPVRSWNEGKLRGLRNKIFTYGDPELIQAREDRMERRNGTEPAHEISDPNDALDQVRRLLTAPLEARVAELERAITDAQRVAHEALQQRNRAWETLDALAGLINEEVTGRG